MFLYLFSQIVKLIQWLHCQFLIYKILILLQKVLTLKNKFLLLNKWIRAVQINKNKIRTINIKAHKEYNSKIMTMLVKNHKMLNYRSDWLNSNKIWIKNSYKENNKIHQAIQIWFKKQWHKISFHYYLQQIVLIKSLNNNNKKRI
jgi:hypothetical protein